MQYRFHALMGILLFLLGSPAMAADKPKAGTAPTAASAPNPQPSGLRPRLVDINSASASELKTLPGIGDADAARIIANRPYLTKSHLVTKKVLELGPYDALRGRIIAVQPEPPKAKTKTQAKS